MLDFWSEYSSLSYLKESGLRLLNVAPRRLNVTLRVLNVASKCNHHKPCNIRRILIDNRIVDHSGVVGASPVGVAPTTSSFAT